MKIKLKLSTTKVALIICIFILLFLLLLILQSHQRGEFARVIDLGILAIILTIIFVYFFPLYTTHYSISQFFLSCLILAFTIIYISWPRLVEIAFPKQLIYCVFITFCSALLIIVIKKLLKSLHVNDEKFLYAFASTIGFLSILVEKIILTDNSFTKYLDTFDDSITARLFQEIKIYFKIIPVSDREAIFATLLSLCGFYLGLVLFIREKQINKDR